MRYIICTLFKNNLFEFRYRTDRRGFFFVVGIQIKLLMLIQNVYTLCMYPRYVTYGIEYYRSFVYLPNNSKFLWFVYKIMYNHIYVYSCEWYPMYSKKHYAIWFNVLYMMMVVIFYYECVHSIPIERCTHLTGLKIKLWPIEYSFDIMYNAKRFKMLYNVYCIWLWCMCVRYV